ncbi:hypothetical protein, partial [Aquisalimonas sp.]|uniref:hypothetical protein n=1 Tax=Aquisalimonas sp. TaxID=1872621 RepID=UPI0025BC2762
MAEHVAADWWEPQPFRQAAIDGRQFSYNAESFLHRFTFEPAPALGSRGWPLPDGIFGTGGSTRSDELYTRQQIQLTADFDGSGYFRYRFRRFEDFDGRYDSNLVGFGATLANGWMASLYGDVEGAKETIDVRFDLAWGDGAGNRFHAAIVAPDTLFNDKQREARFDRQPYTFYVAGARRLGNAVAYGFANYNDPVRLNDNVRDFSYRYEQGRGGVGLDVPIAPRWESSVEVEGLYTTRRLDDRGGEEVPDQRLRRRHNQVTGELRHGYGPATDLWGGVRYFRLMERDRGAAGDPLDRHERRERMVYGGVTWRFNERMQFAPGV